MGIQRRKFTVGFKQQVVHEIESGMISLSEASRKYEVSSSVINRWRTKFRAGDLVEGKSSREKLLEAENRALKEKVGELYMQVEHLKKLEVYARRQKSADTSVITSKNLGRFQKGAK